MTQIRTTTITVDCADALAVATFWAGLAGGTVADGATAEYAGLGGSALGPMSFVQVPEPKGAKNRMHVDLTVDDLDAEVARARSLGARVHARYDDGSQWVTLLDPEGNEFCLVAS